MQVGRGGSAALVSAARTGDQTAWSELYRLHTRRLIVWFDSLPSSDWAASAEDIVAEAWLTAAAKIGEFRGSDDDFVGWLFTIARNHAANSRRTAARRRTDPIAVESSTEVTWGTVADETHTVHNQDTIRRLLSHLSPREAQVVACIDVVGLDVASTARALGMKPGAVRAARHRALGRLRKFVVVPAGSPDVTSKPDAASTIVEAV
jgi:RNA polymerase sigma-70 factor (ECF subfamily)